MIRPAVRRPCAAVALENAVIEGDALRVLPRLPEGHADLTVFSPPYDGIRDYGSDWTLDVHTLGQELFRVTADGGVCAVVIGDGTKNFAYIRIPCQSNTMSTKMISSNMSSVTRTAPYDSSVISRYLAGSGD